MVSERVGPASPRQRGDSHRAAHTIAAGAVVFCIQLAHGTAEGFLYDAVQYWYGALALLTGGNVSDVGVLSIRGTLTPLVYLPPAAVTTLLGDWSAAWTVLCWNGLLAAVVCVVLLPRIAARIAPGNATLRIWVAALLGGVLLSGFARYPLLDVWSLAFALAGLLALLAAKRWWWLALGGLSLGVAVNLRPSYLVPVAIAAIVILISRPRSVAWVAVGAVSGAVPQVVFNTMVMGELSLSPVATPFLLRVQAAQAAFAIRYDTVAFVNRHPQQWYCDPGYASALAGEPQPTGPLDVLLSAARHLPESLWFLGEKVSANLHWSFATPYEHSPGPGTSLMTLIVVVVSGVGLIALIWRAARREGTRSRHAAIAVLGFWFGALATLLLSTPETRFALPLVLVGLLGVIVAVPEHFAIPRGRRAAAVALCASAVLLVIVLFLSGKAGLANPLPPGPMPDVISCLAGGSGEQG